MPPALVAMLPPTWLEPLEAKVDRIEEAPFRSVLLQRPGHHPRLAAHDAVHRVEAEDAVHAVEGDDDLPVARHRPAGKPRAPARRHQGEPSLVGQPRDGNDLVDGFREYDGTGRHLEVPGPVASPGLKVAGVGLHPVGRENVL